MSHLISQSEVSGLYLQLYSLRHEISVAPEATLRLVPDLGFKGVELAGDYGWPAKRWRELLDETGLSVIASHQGLESLESKLSECIAFHTALGTKHFVVPGLSSVKNPSVASYRDAARRLNALGRELAGEGFSLSYHNHDFEFAALPGDGAPQSARGMDILLAETDPATVHFEVDTFWLEYAGLNSTEYIRSNASRVSLIHAKDFRRRDRKNVPAGQGDVDLGALLSMCSASDWPLIVEYEGRGAVEAVRQASTYLRNIPR